MSLFKSKVELTPEQEEQKKFIEAILSKETTVISIEPTKMIYILTNKETYVEIDSVGIQIDGDCFTYHRQLEGKVIDMFKDLCKAEATKRRNAVRETKLQKTLEKLQTLKNTL